MKATSALINKLRAQLPPEAQATLDELEGFAGDGEEDDLMLGGPEEGTGMDGLRDTLGESDELMEEGSDEPVDVDAAASLDEEEEEEELTPPAKKPAPKKKPFFS